MQSLSAIRNRNCKQLRYDLSVVGYIVKTNTTHDLVTYRDNHDGWTAAEIIGHLLDCERLFIERTRLIMAYDCPDLPFPDQAEDVLKGCYNEREPQAILADWTAAREEYLAFLAAIPEEGWQRDGRHPRYPQSDSWSISDLSFLASWHDLLHVEQMTRVLLERKLIGE